MEESETSDKISDSLSVASCRELSGDFFSVVEISMGLVKRTSAKNPCGV